MERHAAAFTRMRIFIYLYKNVYKAVLYVYGYFSYEQSFLLGLLCFKIKSTENSMEGQRSFRGFRSRNEAPELKSRASNNGAQIRNVRPRLFQSPSRPSQLYIFLPPSSAFEARLVGKSTSDPTQRRREPGEGFGKKTARTTFSSTPNIRKLIFWSA